MDICPSCRGSVFAGRVDATFRLVDESLADVFDVPGWICVLCDELYLAPRWIDLLGLEGARCLVAIATEAGLVGAELGRD
ncbi:MAG TPA: YgiT-type zinc finger protein [Candidatus Limnocylindrales bacterium]